MKNVFKLSFAALALLITVSACNSNKTSDDMSDSDTIMTTVDTGMVVGDTMTVDTMGTDTIR